MPRVPEFSTIDRMRGLARSLLQRIDEPPRADPSTVNRSAVKLYPDPHTQAVLRQMSGPHWRRLLESD